MKHLKPLTLATLLAAGAIALPALAEEPQPESAPAAEPAPDATILEVQRTRPVIDLTAAPAPADERTSARRAAAAARLAGEKAQGAASPATKGERPAVVDRGAARAQIPSVPELRVHEHVVEKDVLDAYNRGTMLMQRGNPETAVQLLTDAVTRDPEFPEAHANLSRALRLLGGDNLAAALEHAQQATTLASSMPEGWFQRGAVKVYLGDVEGAKNDMESLRALEPSVYTHALAEDLAAIIEAGQEVGGQGSPAHNPILRPGQEGTVQSRTYFLLKDRHSGKSNSVRGPLKPSE